MFSLAILWRRWWYTAFILDYGSGNIAESKSRSPLTEREAGSFFGVSPIDTCEG